MMIKWSYRFSFFPIQRVGLCDVTIFFVVLINPINNDHLPGTVPEYGQRLHEDLQPDLHDAADWTLVGMSSIPRAHAAGIPSKLVGRHQRITGELKCIISTFQSRHRHWKRKCISSY